MTDALVGYSGFVGSTLLRQRAFDGQFRSTNIHEIVGRGFSTVVCAGAPAKKWFANKNPETDRASIDQLIAHLDTIRVEKFVLISTVDVFANPIDTDESTAVRTDQLHPYGIHRRHLEEFVEDRFPRSLIVRLPGLVGPGLRKNVVFDLLNQNNLDAVDHRSVFQFYPMVNLWSDVEIALAHDLDLVHLTAEPVDVGHLAEAGFGRRFVNEVDAVPARYDFKSRHAHLFGATCSYQYSIRETTQAVRHYAQSEALSSMDV